MRFKLLCPSVNDPIDTRLLTACAFKRCARILDTSQYRLRCPVTSCSSPWLSDLMQLPTLTAATPPFTPYLLRSGCLFDTPFYLLLLFAFFAVNISVVGMHAACCYAHTNFQRHTRLCNPEHMPLPALAQVAPPPPAPHQLLPPPLQVSAAAAFAHVRQRVAIQ